MLMMPAQGSIQHHWGLLILLQVSSLSVRAWSCHSPGISHDFLLFSSVLLALMFLDMKV